MAVAPLSAFRSVCAAALMAGLLCGGVTGGALAQGTGNVPPAPTAAQLSAFLPALANYTSIPGVTGAFLEVDEGDGIDNSKIDVGKFSLEGSFELERLPFDSILGFTVGYLQSDREFLYTNDSGTELALNTNYEVYSAMLHAGVRTPMRRAFWGQAGLGLGFSHFDTQAHPLSSDPAAIDPPANFKADAATFAGHVGIGYDQFFTDYRLEGEARLHTLVTEEVNTTDSRVTMGHFVNTATALGRVSFPTPYRLWDRPLWWNAFATFTGFLGNHREILGFDHFVELGLGADWLVADRSNLFNALRVRGSIVVGDTVQGWSVGASFRF